MLPKEILQKVRNIEIRTRHIVNDVFAGEYHSAFQGQGMEFQEVREYMPGDDIRTIDWNVTARMNQPFIKKFTEERETTMILVVDISASHQFGSGRKTKMEVAAEIASILAFAAIKNNDKVGLLLHTDQVEKFIAPGKGTRHVLRVITEVLTAQPTSTGTDLRPALENLNLVTRRKSILFLIGDFRFPDPEAHRRPLNVLARRHDLAAILIEDRLEHTWPNVGLIEWRDAETGATRVLDTSHRRTREALTEHHRTSREELTQSLRRASIDTVQIDATNEAYDLPLMRFFKQRAQRLRG